MADEKGLVWPENIAPYKYHVVAMGEKGLARALEIYQGHEEEILLDDRDARFGEKMKDAELMGMPFRVVVSDKTLADENVEIVSRATGEAILVSVEEFKKKLD